MCTCGNPEPHVMARRQTFDGMTVKVWSDGALTTGFNNYIIRGSRGARLQIAVNAAWFVADMVSLYESSEVRKLALTARKAFNQRSLSPRAYFDREMN